MWGVMLQILKFLVSSVGRSLSKSDFSRFQFVNNDWLLCGACRPVRRIALEQVRTGSGLI